MLLVLGAAGFVGTALARQAAADDRDVHLLVRRPTPELQQWGKVHIGDARAPDLGLDRNTAAYIRQTCTSVVLTMGSVGMDFTLREARAQHLAPLRAALAFLGRCDQLERVVYLSSIAAIGDTEDRMPSDRLPLEPQFRNYYEWAKFNGERLVVGSDLPSIVVRPGHILNSTDGEFSTRAPMVVFEALPYLAARGALVMGNDLTYWSMPVDGVADVVLAAADGKIDRRAIWAVDPASPSLHQILDVLAVRHGIGGMRLVAPRLASVLSSVVKPSRLGSSAPPETMSYLHATYDLDLSCIEQALADGVVRAAPDRSWVTNTIDHEVARWKELP